MGVKKIDTSACLFCVFDESVNIVRELMIKLSFFILYCLLPL